MTYTNEEYEILKANTKQIEQYLRSQIPNVRKSITVTFGDMTTRGRYGEIREPEYEIVLTTEGLHGHSGGLRLDFDDTPRTDFNTNVYSRGFGANYMGKLIRDWPTVKRAILSKIREQQSEISAIRNFTL